MSNAQDNTKHSEDKLQADCFQWFHNTYPHLRGLLYHVPNGEKRDPITANLLKAKGVVAGVPDLEFHYRARTVFFELKNPDGSGRISAVQRKIHEALDKQRFIVHVIIDLDSFKAIVEAIIHDTSYQYTLGLTKEEYYYRHKVFDYIYSLSEGDVVKIADITAEDTRAKFMNYVSDFMIESFDKLAGFEILFTPDYKGFYRRNLGSDKEIEYKN